MLRRSIILGASTGAQGRPFPTGLWYPPAGRPRRVVRGLRHQTIIYKQENGTEPYVEYLAALRDRNGVAKIRARVTRAELGNLGDHCGVGAGVIELRIHYGPGYRVYIGIDGPELIVLLCAGDKSRQEDDIRNALDYWRDYRGSR